MKYQMWSIRFHVYSSVPAITVQRYALVFIFFSPIFCSLSNTYPMNAVEMGLLFWKPLFGCFRLQTKVSKALWACSVPRHGARMAPVLSPAPAGKGRKGHWEMSAGEITTEMAWAGSKSASDRFCNVLMFLQHQQAMQDLILWAQPVQRRGCCLISRISEMWGNRV